MKIISNRILLALTALSCGFALTASVAHAKKPEKGESSLVRPADGPDDDARGNLRVRSQKNDERFDVKAKAVDSEGDPSVELWIADEFDTQTLIGDLRRSDDDGGDATYHYRARIKKGKGDLPLGANDVGDLAGRAVEIRSDGEVVLEGTVPATGASPRDGGKARQELDATVDAPDDARARLSLRSKPLKGDERFEVKIDDFPLGDGEELRLFIEDPANAGVLEDVGGFENRGDDESRFRARTRKGDRLPFGVDGVAALEGLEIEVRSEGGGTTYFSGLIPALD